MRFSLAIIALVLVAGAVAGIGAAQEVSDFTTPTEPPAAVTLPAPGSEQGYFSINSVPSGADCYFDGIWQGETPMVVTVSTTGTPTHTIRLNLAGYQEWTSTYNGNPGPGETIPITATLIPNPQAGSVQVSSSPSGATAILDDTRSGITPTTFTNVPVGSHSVQVYLSGYQTSYNPVNVQQGQTSYVSVSLSPVVTVGSLSITSSPSGATVYVDGVYRGVTPATVGNLQQGTHPVELAKAGYQGWQDKVTITAGVTTYTSIKLDPDPQPTYGTVSIVSNPAGADVYGDGVYVGRTVPGNPLVFSQVKPGSHTLLLTKAGYQDYTSTGTVVAGKNYDLTINLLPVPNPTTGGISVSSSPAGAEVYVNNVFRGLSPLTVDGLTPGSYSVLVRLTGYQDWQSSTLVSAGSTVQLTAMLIPAPIRTETTPPTPIPTQTPLLPCTAVAGLVAGAGIVLFLRKR